MKEHTPVEQMTHLTEKQKERVKHWISLQDTLNNGKFGEEMDAHIDTEKFTYGNPNRPDLGTYWEWKTSPEQLYHTFPPSKYSTLDATAKGDDEIWVYCHHYGLQTGGPYMGMEPKGQEINTLWFSIVKFEGDKIVHIYSIADVLGMMIAVGKLDENMQPVDPYK
jgi:predicted ester cyclase